jgi:competence protein ComEA
MAAGSGSGWSDGIQWLPRISWRSAGLAVAVPLVIVGGCLALRPDPRPAAIVLPRAGDVPLLTTTTAAEGDEAPGAPTIVIHAAGAVMRPGVYRLSDPARVIDLLDAAGGPLAGADLSGVNLAALLPDGARVHFPSAGEEPPAAVDIIEAIPDPPAPARPDGGAGEQPGEPVDINAASAGEFERLPGIGPVIAAAIVSHRDRMGPFRSVEALQDVTGIGPVKLAGIRDLVTVGP